LPFLKKYKELQKVVGKGIYGEPRTVLFAEIFEECDKFLSTLEIEDLISKVPGKEYFAFRMGGKSSRAVNKELFCRGMGGWDLLRECLSNNDLSPMSKTDLERTLYTLAISFCACIDIVKERDQQTPGTFFGYLVAYLLHWRLGVEPKTSIKIMSVEGEADVNLQTDLIYDLGLKKQKFHVPVKTSSRERAIMLWAHQKLLDGAYGIERYMGTPVLLAETKLDKKNREVVEICLPDQWKVYQLYIARLKRVYYLDMPTPYLRLQGEFPPIMVKSFADLFSEWDDLMPV